ncbi:dihydrofolate reductase [Atractiella rhizophila]|nr:dihydrofolate reductase [Atractiella rhizophila]
MESITPFLDKIYTSVPAPNPSARPLITLTFAQSLDSRIGLRHVSSPLILSGPLSSTLTHSLRARHDAILVGVSTLLADNSQLNARSPPLPSSSVPTLDQQPVPIVLDPKLRAGTGSRVLKNAKEGKGRRPIWIAALGPQDDREGGRWERRKKELVEAGAAVVLGCKTTNEGHISLPDLLSILANTPPPLTPIHSIMVEGGSRVIRSFLQHHLVDLLIITIAPVIVGANGVQGFAWDGSEETIPKLESLGNLLLGNDVVMACKTTI